MKVNLRWYDWIVLNSSSGKDSQAMLDEVVRLADEQGVPRSKLVVVHADLGRVEWEGTKELAERHARHYGLRFEVVRRPGGDLLDAVLARHKRLVEQGKGHVPAWMSPQARYCTSGFKRGPVRTLFTRLAGESRRAGLRRRVRILNCLGLRADESTARSKLLPFRLDKPASGTLKRRRDGRKAFVPSRRRVVHTWLPLHSWSTQDVWDRIFEIGTDHHPAYDLGMPRLSCVFCVMAPKEALVLAGKHNPELLARYVEVEGKVGASFKVGLPMAEVQRCVQEGEQVGRVESWVM